METEKVVDLKINPLHFHKETLINANDLTLKYEDAYNELFSGLKFQVKRGERVIISGENGCLSGSLRKYCESNGLNESLFLALLRQLDFEREQFVNNIEELLQYEPTMLMVEHDIRFQEKVATKTVKVV